MSKSNLIISTSIRTKDQLIRLQKLPLEQKVNLSKRRISQFYHELDGKVYIGFSGGKDSTVLLHLVRELYPNTPAVFCDTGLEFPEIRSFVKTIHNTVWLKPKITFKQVLEKYGFPVISKEVAQKVCELRTSKGVTTQHTRRYGDSKGNGKLAKKWLFLEDAPFKISHKCCDIMKKNPSKAYEKKTGLSPITGEMGSESNLRTVNWVRYGCNAFSGKRKKSTPLAFWTDKDIWEYINSRGLKYCSIYDMGYKRTGCMFCMFGAQYNNDLGRGRFNTMKNTHPKIYSYCMENLGMRKVFEFLEENNWGK